MLGNRRDDTQPESAQRRDARPDDSTHSVAPGEDAARGLQVERASIRFDPAAPPALNAVDLRLQTGRVMAVLGPSGCGKSTLLRAIAGLQPLDSGEIRFDGQSLAGVATHRRDFALMFQDGQLFGHMSVGENVAYGLRRRGLKRAATADRVAELLALVGMEGYEKRNPSTLSGGQQQRVALARALAPRPRLLLLDEPLSALDRTLRERLAADLREVLTAEGATALFVTHDHTEALTIADDMAVMQRGEVVDVGPARRVWEHPHDVETARFLGYSNVLSGQLSQQFGFAGAVALRPMDVLASHQRPQQAAVGGVVHRAVMTPHGAVVQVTLDGPVDADRETHTGAGNPQLLECLADPAQALSAGERVWVSVRTGAGVRFTSD